MLDRFEQLNMSQVETEWFCRGLIDLAKSDGMHAAELAMIEEFCAANQFTADDIQRFSTAGFEASLAQDHLRGETLDAFFSTCFVLAYADGQYSELEAQRLSSYAQALNYSVEQLEVAHVNARVFLISSLASELKNHAVLREIGAGFGLNDEQISLALSGGN